MLEAVLWYFLNLFALKVLFVDTLDVNTYLVLLGCMMASK